MTDKEQAIAELQQWFRNIMKSGGAELAVIPDGIYSEETRGLVEEFQKNNALEVTGVVNYETWEAVKRADRELRRN